MTWAITGILLGIIIGLISNFTIPPAFIKYTAVIIIGILDSLFGALKANYSKEKYNSTIFLIGLLFNTILALTITFIGEKLGLDLYLAVTVVFTIRIFTNLSKLRNVLFDKYIEKTTKSKK